MPYLRGSRPCAHTGCGKRFIPKKLGSAKENRIGWFLQGNGVVWCPNHTEDRSPNAKGEFAT